MNTPSKPSKPLSPAQEQLARRMAARVMAKKAVNLAQQRRQQPKG
jgi:hypothetical protein